MRVRKSPLFGEIVKCFTDVNSRHEADGAGKDLPSLKKGYTIVGVVEDITAKQLYRQATIFLSRIETLSWCLVTLKKTPFMEDVCAEHEEKISLLRNAVEICRDLFWSHVQCDFDVCREEVFLTRTWEIVSMTGNLDGNKRQLRAMFPGVNHPARTFFQDVCVVFKDGKENKAFKKLRFRPVVGDFGDVVTGMVLCAHLKSLLCLSIRLCEDIKMREKRRHNTLRACGIEHLKKKEALIDKMFWFGVLEKIGRPCPCLTLAIREDGVVVVTPRYVAILHLIIVG